LDPQLCRQVQAVLGANKAERHLRGGAATRLKYSRG
ncbi:sporulation transcriptional regulator SpoIIID, partial [Candidatus Allofournierella excrementigallinarum]